MKRPSLRYRLNFLDDCGQVVRSLDIDARSDDAARRVAAAYAEGRVVLLRATPPAGGSPPG